MLYYMVIESYDTLVVTVSRVMPHMFKALSRYIKELKKKEKSIVTIKEIKDDPKINEMLEKTGDQKVGKIMVEVRLNEEDKQQMDRIRREITESGKVLGIDTIGPYKVSTVMDRPVLFRTL